MHLLTLCVIAAIFDPTSPNIGALEAAPVAHRSNQVNAYFGTAVADPYRWLESDRDPETQAWASAQNARTAHWLGQGGIQAKLAHALRQVSQFGSMGTPTPTPLGALFGYNSGDEPQEGLYLGQPGDKNSWRQVLDPTRIAPLGRAAIMGRSMSPCGRYLAYAVSEAGSDRQRWQVRRIRDGQDLPDVLVGINVGALAWAADGNSFYYTRSAAAEKLGDMAPNGQDVIYRHRVGSPQADDTLEFAHPDARFDADVHVAHDGSLLTVDVAQGSDRRRGLFAKDLRQGAGAWRRIVPEQRADYRYVGAADGHIVAISFDGAPLGKLVRLDARDSHEALAEPVTLIAEHASQVLHRVVWTQSAFIAAYIDDAASRLMTFGLNGEPGVTISVGDTVWAAGISGNPRLTQAFVTLTSNTLPPTIYSIDVGPKKAVLKRVFSPEVHADLAALTTYRIFARTEDGHKLPLLISHKRDLPCLATGGCPTKVYAYGGFTLPVYPSFHAADVVWMQHGGIVVRAVTRGGGEYGSPWHADGSGANKQHTFDDLIRGLDRLVAQGLSHHDQIGIEGSSNGGLLAAVTLTQHPEKVGAVYAHAAVLDMLRFAQYTAGRGWLAEYGDVTQADAFCRVLAYSPLQNIRAKALYPPTLVVTGDHDDRVVPGFSYKFVAALQHAQGLASPMFLQVLANSGHGAGTLNAQRLAEDAAKLTFLAKALNLVVSDTLPQPTP